MGFAFRGIRASPRLPPAAQAQPAPGCGPNIALETARKVVGAGIANAQQRNLQTAVAVVDTAGNLAAFTRVDRTQPASLQVALDKAKSAAAYAARPRLSGMR